MNPRWFAENILNLRVLDGEPTLEQDPNKSWELDIWQGQLLDAMADVVRKQRGLPTVINHEGKAWFSVSAMHGPGKTFTAATIAHWFNFCFPGRIVVVAPKFNQLKTRFFPEFRKIAGRAEGWYKTLIDVQDTKATWCGDKDWVMIAETAKHPENLAGHHYSHMLFIIEEATGVPETLWPVIFGALSTGQVVMLLMISNPTKRQGTFAMSHLDPVQSKDYFRMQLSLAVARRVSRAWVEKMRSRYGENSPIYRIRALGEFADDDANQLVATGWVTGALQRDFDTDGSLPRLRVSVDVADGGDDETVCTGARHYESHTRFLQQRSHSFGIETGSIDAANAAESMFIALGGRKEMDDFVVDASGVGTGCAGELVSRGYKVIRYKGGESSSDPKKWRNRRVQSHMVARDALRDGRISFADDCFPNVEEQTEFLAQVCSIKSKPNGERVEDLQTREEMRRDGIKSPDRSDSFVMQFATQAPITIGSKIEQTIVTVRSTVLDGFE